MNIHLLPTGGSMRLRTLAVAALAGALALSGCSADEGGTSESDLSYDTSGIAKVDEIAALVPQEIRDAGKLVIGASIDYAPAEFRADDLQTAIGYDVDLGKALGRVLDLDTEVSAAEFASILPGIGSKYDVGISSFTITEERTANYTMVSYISVGSSYAVKAGNDKGFDPDDICGRTVAVQTGTYQEEELATFSTACTDAGKAAVDVLKFGSQADVTTNVAGGKAEAMYADSTVSEYAVALTNGQVEVVGGVRDSAPQGIVVAADDTELAAAIQQALQHLMDDGTWVKILESWGPKDAALSTAEIFPAS
ncbi:MAG: ABC transporter substrate-binding protein [Propionibacteriaceae bacterium]|nr:ABC transporter substrate-binding protein [Propionibacteriaceae bacterium]